MSKYHEGVVELKSVWGAYERIVEKKQKRHTISMLTFNPPCHFPTPARRARNAGTASDRVVVQFEVLACTELVP